MTLMGTGFNSSSKVNFGTMPNSGGTASADGKTLTITIPGTELGMVGTVNVSVTNSAPGGGTSGNQIFTITDFAINSPTGEQTVTAGGPPAQFSIAVGVNGPTGTVLANNVILTASGLPSASSGTFNPASFLAGSTGGTSTLTLQTTARGAVPPLGAPRPPRPFVLLWVLAGMLALLSLVLVRRGVRTRRLALYLPLGLLLLSMAAIVGCAGGAAGTPAGTSSIIVTATSGGVTHTTTVRLTVN